VGAPPAGPRASPSLRAGQALPAFARRPRRQLRSLAVVVAACLGGLNFPTTQCLDLEHPLVAHGRFVIRALGPWCRLTCAGGPLVLFGVTHRGFPKVAPLSIVSLTNSAPEAAVGVLWRRLRRLHGTAARAVTRSSVSRAGLICKRREINLRRAARGGDVVNDGPAGAAC